MSHKSENKIPVRPQPPAILGNNPNKDLAVSILRNIAIDSENELARIEACKALLNL